MGHNRLCKLLLLVVLGIFVAAPVMAVPIANLNLVDSPSGVGDTFEVEVWADGDDIGLELLAFGFDVSFEDGSIFTYDGYTMESGFDDFSDPSIFGNVSGDVFPGIPDNDILLATLSFSVTAFGTDTLNITGIYDEMFYGLYYETPDFEWIGYDINASLTITAGAAAPIPEPASFLLIATGLLGLAGINRKFGK